MAPKSSPLLAAAPDAQAPAPHTAQLPSGLAVQWHMPDPFAIIAFAGTVPSPLTAAVIKLLLEEGSFTPETDPRHFAQKAEQIRGMYGIAQAMLVSPQLDCEREWGGNGVLGRREIGIGDVTHLYWLFRIGTAPAAELTARTDDADRPQEPT